MPRPGEADHEKAFAIMGLAVGSRATPVAGAAAVLNSFASGRTRPGPWRSGAPRFLLLSSSNGLIQKILEGLRAYSTLFFRYEKIFQDHFLPGVT